MDIRLPKLLPRPIKRRDRADAGPPKPADGSPSTPKDEGPSKQKEPGRVDILIAYGTTTGTARDVADRIAREAYNYKIVGRPVHYFRPRVVSMKDISVDYLNTHWVGNNAKTIFVISTTGQGEFPDDSREFWSELSANTAPEVPIHSAVFGLVPRYGYYNVPGEKLHRRLKELNGIVKFLNPCLLNEESTYYTGDSLHYLKRLWAAWVPETCEVSGPVARYTLLSSNSENVIPCQPDQMCDKLELRKVIRNERLTAEDHSQDTRLIAFETEASNLRFREGDVVQVYPENLPENVKGFFDLFPQLKDQPPFFLISDPDMQWVNLPPVLHRLCGAQPWTWEEVALKLLNLQSIPGVSEWNVLGILHYFANDPSVKEKLGMYVGIRGLAALYKYTDEPRRSILDVLREFPSTAALVPPNYLFELFPFMRPRAYFVASPPKESHHIEILVAVVQYKNKLNTDRKGTCSYWLANNCSIGKKVGIFIDKGPMRPPTEFPKNAHVVMIGTGTGVAPFRSMIKQHAGEWDKHLFFGCRNKNKDFYFGEEFSQMVGRNELTFYPAFSRDRIGRKVNYVQELLIKEDTLFNRMVYDSLPLYIYVCGRIGDMSKDVWNDLKYLLYHSGVYDAEEFLQYMIENGYYQTVTY